ncbi:hypothetical protein ACLQ25_17855 [Micromonospora sp. DT44]|uniref:hypothetical protein n=1 Tax=Micromonospora sp. DT44 TaxID=3393439 RepID=UPI003CFB8D3E
MTAPMLAQRAVAAEALAPALAGPDTRWRRTLAEHQGVDGRCPVCRVRSRCREWAEAFGQLVAHDLLLPAGGQPTGQVRS